MWSWPSFCAELDKGQKLPKVMKSLCAFITPESSMGSGEELWEQIAALPRVVCVLPQRADESMKFDKEIHRISCVFEAGRPLCETPRLCQHSPLADTGYSPGTRAAAGFLESCRKSKMGPLSYYMNRSIL